MFALGHLSDLHLAARPQLKALAGKRGLGFINWHRGRKFIHRSEVVDALTRDLKANAPDHIAVTGDLINFSVPAEYLRAQAWLEGLGPPSDVTVIPGNHDIYVPQAEHWPAKYWGEYMRGDTGAEGAFPFVRRRGAVALIALSSALPTGPFMATGLLGQQQLMRFAAALEQTRGLFRVVLIHHPPKSLRSRHLRRLIERERALDEDPDFINRVGGPEAVRERRRRRHELVTLAVGFVLGVVALAVVALFAASRF